MAGLQQGDREGEDEVTRHHQQQQDPEHVGHHGSINADEEDEELFQTWLCLSAGLPHRGLRWGKDNKMPGNIYNAV